MSNSRCFTAFAALTLAQPSLGAQAPSARLLAGTSAAPQPLIGRSITARTAPPACVAPASTLALTFAHEFAGVSQADHESDVWTGRVSGALTGDLVMTLQLLGSPVDAARPVWKVRTHWTLTSGRDTTLVAELYGTVNWRTGMMRLSGAVTHGCRSGSEANVDGRFVDMNGSGTLRIFPSVTRAQADVSVSNP